MNAMLLYHTGFKEIPAPDIRIGRKSADFGQGFYLSPDEAFSRRWARTRRGETTWLNSYELSTDVLSVKRFARSADWFDYIFKNRTGYPDALAAYDVVIGPIANDTIYDTWGIVTSGMLQREQALALLMIGPEYVQVVLKTERAAEQLRFRGTVVLSADEIAETRAIVAAEQEEYQRQFVQVLEKVVK